MGVLGYKHSKESIQKIIESNKRRVYSKETLEKMRLSQLGKKASPETIKKVAKASRKPIKFVKDEKGCYICTSHATVVGYPVISRDKKRYRMGRYLYSLKYGPIPEGMFVCHTCDTPKCINIKHFFLGTAQDNSDDMINKGRYKPTYGTINGQSTLTEKDIINIRSYTYYKGLHKELGKLYNVTQTHIWSIRSKRSWKHIP